MQREQAGKPPWLRFVFSKAFPFHAGQQNPPRFRAPFRAARPPHMSELSILHVIRKSRAVAARPPGACREEIFSGDADPDAGDPDPPEGPRPARHRPDRHRQDRGLHAAVDRPAAPRPSAAPGRVLPDARACADPRACQPDRRERAAYGQFSQMRSPPCSAATSIGKKRRDLARGVDVLVATPGRLLDLIEQRYLTLREVEILVLDEADQMLDLGFIHALKQIVKMAPGEAPDPVLLGDHAEDDPRARRPLPQRSGRGRVAPAATTAERVEQYVSFVNQAEKQALLTMMLRVGFARRADGAGAGLHPHQARRRPGGEALAGNGIAAAAIHGNKSQPQRERALAEFKAGKAPILVATDIAARGIDVTGVSHVINFELPNVAEQYVHRIGRTARAGAGRRGDRLLRRRRAGLSARHREADPSAHRGRAAAGQLHRRGGRIKSTRGRPARRRGGRPCDEVPRHEERRPSPAGSARPLRRGGQADGGEPAPGARVSSRALASQAILANAPADAAGKCFAANLFLW